MSFTCVAEAFEYPQRKKSRWYKSGYLAGRDITTNF